MDEREVLAVMVQVAANAVFAVGISHLQLKVITVLGGKPPGDFLVAIETLESGSAGAKYVAVRALRGSGKGLVSLCKRSRRDLRVQ